MKKIVVCSVVLLMLGGCAHEMPVGKAFETPEQLKLNSAFHWNVLARHEAGMVKKTLESFSNLPVYIKPPAPRTPFMQAYHHLLTSNLAGQGIAIMTEPEFKFNVATISYVVDIVQHPSHRYKEHRELTKPLARGVYYLTATALAKGAYDITESAIDVIKVPFYAVGNQLKPDFSSLAEVVITTQMTMGKQVLNSDSRVYYVEKANLAHYDYGGPVPLPHHFTVTDR
ncbi:MAG: hypothetical protein RQ715_10075 [Methylococcales bacterium]|nr:hypothetical protein [Methylococcales bacterium]